MHAHGSGLWPPSQPAQHLITSLNFLYSSFTCASSTYRPSYATSYMLSSPTAPSTTGSPFSALSASATSKIRLGILLSP